MTRTTAAEGDATLMKDLAPDVLLLVGLLLELVRSSHPLPCDCLRAMEAHRVRNYELESGLLAIPLLGRSRITDGPKTIDVEPGQILIVPNARAIDWEQFPDDQAGEYVAIGIHLDQSLLESAQKLLQETVAADPGQISVEPLSLLIQPLLRWTDVMAQGKRALSLHAIVEVIVRLHEVGHLGLLRIPRPSLASQIRKLVVGDPGRDWLSEDFEDRLGISGPTLRRRLAAEGTSLRAVLVDARVGQALHLLLTTRLPVKTIAAKVGYDSATTFSKRFTERYSLDPANVGRR